MISRKGFTLLEVLIALAILVVGVAAVVNVFPVGLQATKRGADFSSAALLAQEKMAEFERLGYNNWSSIDSDLTAIPSNTIDMNSFPEPTGVDKEEWFGKGHQWFAYVRDGGTGGEGAGGLDNLFAKVALLVYWNDRGSLRYSTFVTYVADYD